MAIQLGKQSKSESDGNLKSAVRWQLAASASDHANAITRGEGLCKMPLALEIELLWQGQGFCC